MTCPIDEELHDAHAPAVFRFLMMPQVLGKTDFACTLVMLETVILGALFVAKQQGADPKRVLDVLHTNLLARIETDEGRTMQ